MFNFACSVWCHDSTSVLIRRKVGIADAAGGWAVGWMTRKSGTDTQQRQGTVPFNTTSVLALGPTQLPVHCLVQRMAVV